MQADTGKAFREAVCRGAGGDYAAYAVAKGAIATLTASLAQEVLDDGVMVNAIAPSTIDTEANRVAMPKAKHQNWVRPADIARTIAYLCSDLCRARQAQLSQCTDEPERARKSVLRGRTPA